MALAWKPYGPGNFAKSIHGYYLTYQNFDIELGVVRWFASFEGRSDKSREEVNSINFHGFDSLQDAQAICETHAQAFES